MATENNKSNGFHLPILQGVLPIKGAQIPAEVIAGLTLDDVVKDYNKQTG